MYTFSLAQYITDQFLILAVPFIAKAFINMPQANYVYIYACQIYYLIACCQLSSDLFFRLLKILTYFIKTEFRNINEHCLGSSKVLE